MSLLQGRVALALLLQLGLSSWACVHQLQGSKEGAAVAHEISHMWELQLSGGNVDLERAKRLGGHGLRLVLSTHLGMLCTGLAGGGLLAAVTLATKALFLGQLSATESSQLTERLLKYLGLKLPMLVLLGSSSPRYGEVTQWLAWTSLMCWLSMFVLLARLRGEALLSSPRAAGKAALASHVRILALLGGILVQVVSWIARYAHTLGDGSTSHALLWLVDPVHVALDAAFSVAKYLVAHAAQQRAAAADARGEEREHWEGRSSLVYGLDLGHSLCLLCLDLGHHLHVWFIHGLQFQLVDGALLLEVRYMAAALQQRLARHRAYSRLTRTLRITYPDAPPDRLREEWCPICLETMRAGKQLPCSHVVHASCLTAWLQQQSSCGAGAFTCPLCRSDLDLRLAPPLPAPPAQRSVSHAGTREPRRTQCSDPACGAAGVADATQPPADAAAGAHSSIPPALRITRQHLRLLQAQAAASPMPGGDAPGCPTHTSRPRRRIDGMLE